MSMEVTSASGNCRTDTTNSTFTLSNVTANSNTAHGLWLSC
jgi:hypothetical protein